jgi:hypothetical protein
MKIKQVDGRKVFFGVVSSSVFSSSECNPKIELVIDSDANSTLGAGELVIVVPVRLLSQDLINKIEGELS